jgi:cation diffusion facilitator family transporter
MKLNSQAILATAWANRADCFSSIAVMLGVIGSRFGIPHLDPIAALFVVGVIIKINASILTDSVKSLMDVSVNDHYSDEIKDIVWEIQGVQSISALKTRQVGHHIWAEMNIHVEPLHNLRKAHKVGQMVKDTLLEKIHDLERVTIHIRPLKTVESDG